MNSLKRKYVIAAAGGVVLMALIVGGLLFLAEPRFEGRSLSGWLEDPDLGAPEIRRAVRAIGTNALPSLQAWLLEDVSWLENRVRHVNARQNWFAFDYSPSIDANIRAMRGFLYLEELAEPAIPWLVDGMNKKDNNFMFYAKALLSAGPRGRDALMEIYPDGSFDEKAQIVRAAYLYMHDKPGQAQFYIRFIDDPDPDIAVKAMLNARQLKARCPPLIYKTILNIANDGPTNRQRTARIVVKSLRRWQPE